MPLSEVLPPLRCSGAAVEKLYQFLSNPLCSTCSETPGERWRTVCTVCTDETIHRERAPVVQGAPNNSTSRLFFVKVSYLLRY